MFYIIRRFADRERVKVITKNNKKYELIFQNITYTYLTL